MTSAIAQQLTVLLWDYDDTKGDESLGRYSSIERYLLFSSFISDFMSLRRNEFKTNFYNTYLLYNYFSY